MSLRINSVLCVLLVLPCLLTAQTTTLKTGEVAFVYGSEDATTLDYERAVPLLLSSWEKAYEPILPGATGRVVLKVYTNSGMGLRTPPGLVIALADALEARGFERANIVIADLDSRRLRKAGYLPALSLGGQTFEGMPVIALEDPQYHREEWFYESPLPAHPLLSSTSGDGEPSELLKGDEDRKSFLPSPLLFDLDFWINLPVAIEHPVLGMSGAVANAGVWAVSNQSRFFSRPVSAASSTVEIAAIPELQRSWLFSILSLEAFQIIGGPRFNSLYTESRSEVILSADPLLMDRYALAAINASRLERGFDPISPEPLFFRYGENLELGNAALSPGRLKLIGDSTRESDPEE